MKKAIYYNEGSEKALFVAKEHADGTVDLVAEEGGAVVVVEKCPIASKTGQIGYCSVEGMISKAAKDAEAAKAKATEGARGAKAEAAETALPPQARMTSEQITNRGEDDRKSAAAERAADRKHHNR